MARNNKEKQVPPTLCESCGTPLNNTEMRVFREGLYAIDPNGDSRKLCFKCKERRPLALAGYNGERLRRKA